MRKTYKIRYLPTFEKDLDEALDYIASKLHNPAAAKQLLEETNKATLERLAMPLSFESFFSKKDRKRPYYRIRVKNYVIYYVVMDDVMELRRFLYNRRNIDDLI